MTDTIEQLADGITLVLMQGRDSDHKVVNVEDVADSHVPGLVELTVYDGIENSTERMREIDAECLPVATPVRTVGDLAEIVNEDIPTGSWGCSLPQWFFEQVDSKTAKWTTWVFDDQAGLNGRPQPLTREAYGSIGLHSTKHDNNYEQMAKWPSRTVRSNGQMYVIE